jgi:hypothetical protein
MDRDSNLEPVVRVDNNSEQTKKTWITPQVSESPMNELTQAGVRQGETDANFYS